MTRTCISSSAGMSAFYVLLLSVLVSGCGGSSESTGSVSGNVTRAGQPLAEGTVMFTSTERGDGAAGQLGSGGAYKLLNAAGGSEIPIGNYQVMIVPPTKAVDPTQLMQADPAAKTDEANIPQKYRTGATSGLIATVKEGENTFDFELKD